MKFRCERDTLADAVTTAHRAVASRTGALPVLSGLQVTLGDGKVEFTGSDLELTIRVQVPAQVEGEGTAVLVRAAPRRHAAPSSTADTVTVEIGDDQAKIEGGRFRTRGPHARRRATSRGCPNPKAMPVTRRRRGPLAEASAPGRAGGVDGRRAADPHRVLLIASTGQGVRLVATDSYRLAVRDLQGVSCSPEGQKVLVGAKGLGELQRLLGDGDVEVFLGERVRDVPARRDRAHGASHRR